MRFPNLLLVGVQKSGTTWMHQTLSRSRHIFGSAKKELNLFGQPDYLDRLTEYQSYFPRGAKPGARYFLESTPHYFHAPNAIKDVAGQIKSVIPDARVMVILRNPIERYRSAYIHHMQKGRLPYSASIDVLTDDQIMLSTGLYGKILSHWREVFPDIIVLSHDRLKTDAPCLMRDVFTTLEIECDLDFRGAAAPVHTSEEKRRSRNWPEAPDLTPGLREELVDFYREDVHRLSEMVDFDVIRWLDTEAS
ncbi:MAG: sulfotransferase [Pseudomonadota bacterium]